MSGTTFIVYFIVIIISTILSSHQLVELAKVLTKLFAYIIDYETAGLRVEQIPEVPCPEVPKSKNNAV